ncbi:hypothetical protein H0H93_016997 [Arthromyces matolae]|nr:hypothetical protein H0H93_016997 [Arthromyces matolae]
MSQNKTQKALFIDTKLGPFTLHNDHPIPKPGHGQLLVRIEAAALNPVDWKIQKLGWFVDKYPVLIGTDIAGVVQEVGEGASKGFAKGDRVVFQGAWSGDMAGFQQYALTNAVTTAKIPSHISFDEASTLPVACAAAVAGFYLAPPSGAGLTPPFNEAGRGKYKGKPAVILGGATSVGQFALQLAKLSGFSPIITTASPKHSDHLKTLGATHILDRRLSTESLSAEIHKITRAGPGGPSSNPNPINFVFDSVSSPTTQQTGLNLLIEGGTLVLVLPSSLKGEPSWDVNHVEVDGKQVYTTLGIWTFPNTKDLGEAFYRSLEGLLERGDVKPNRVEVVHGGLGGIVEGLKRMENDLVSGVKLVVHPQETV